MNVSLKFGLFKINIFKSLTVNERKNNREYKR